MDIRDYKNQGNELAGHPHVAGGAIGPAILPPVASETVDESADVGARAGDSDAEETVFTVLAGRVRTHATPHLWLTAGIGGIDAAALMVGRPALWWVAAACAAVTAYAGWGLADRALVNVRPSARWTPLFLRAIMALALVAGVLAAVAAGIGFLGVVLGKSPPTG